MIVLKKLIDKGVNELSFTMKSLVYKSNPGLFDLLNFDDDNIFLEPLLFTYFKAEDPLITLEQILYGYIEDHLKPEQIPVLSDNNGMVFIPRFGYFKTDLRSSLVHLIKSGDNYKLQHQHTELPYVFEDSLFIDSTSIEIYKYKLEIFGFIFNDIENHNRFSEINIVNIDKNLVKMINKAVRFIKEYHPVYYSLLSKTAKGLYLFEYDPMLMYSFAGIDAHGVSFLNMQKYNNEIFFITEFAHQFAHCILNAILYDRTKFFSIHFDTAMTRIIGNIHDTRTLDDAFHGLFTTCTSGLILNTALASNIFKDDKQHELIGRFVDNYYRFQTGLDDVEIDQVFTKKGRYLFTYLTNQLISLYSDKLALLRKYDTTGQPFVFNYPLFKKNNPTKCQVNA
ncbi:MAG: hypothetical protein WKF97_22110 [Chitinophagaceae bacterium]